MRVGLVILPSDRWAEARRQWEWADRAGFHTAWTYDHIRWGGMPDGPWHAAVPVLAAAAAVTERIRLGTLVATPNFRHPVTLARDALALDDVSDGRLDLGLGPGSRRPRRHRARAGALDTGGAPGPLRGVPPGAAAHRRRRAGTRTSVDDDALHRRRGAQHARRRAAAPAPDHRRGRSQGPAARRPARAELGHRRPHRGAGRGTPETVFEAIRANSPSSTRPAAPPAGIHRASAGSCCGRRPNRSSLRSTSSTSWSGRAPSSASTSSSSTTPPRRGRTGRRQDVRADRRAARRRRR